MKRKFKCYFLLTLDEDFFDPFTPDEQDEEIIAYLSEKRTDFEIDDINLPTQKVSDDFLELDDDIDDYVVISSEEGV